MMLIGMAGAAGTGKDTAADYLVDQYGFDRVTFAAPIKRAVGRILDLDLWELEQDKDKTVPWLDLTPRQLMQVVGTECGRALCPDIWVRFAMREVDRLVAAGQDRIVFTDVRFANEAGAIIDAGGYVVRIERGRIRRVPVHASEQALPADQVWQTLQNNSTRALLYRQLDDLLAGLWPELAA